MKSLFILIGLLGTLYAVSIVEDSQQIHFISFNELNELRNKASHHTEELVQMDAQPEHDKQQLKEAVNFAQTKSKTTLKKNAKNHRHHKIPQFTKHHIPSFLQMRQNVEVEMVLVEEEAAVNPVETTILTQEGVEEQVQEEPIVETQNLREVYPEAFEKDSQSEQIQAEVAPKREEQHTITDSIKQLIESEMNQINAEAQQEQVKPIESATFMEVSQEQVLVQSPMLRGAIFVEKRPESNSLITYSGHEEGIEW